MEYAAGSVMNYFSDSHEEKKDDGDDVVVLPHPPAAAAAIKNEEAEGKDSPRRTGRKRTSTTMIINGHVVKTVRGGVSVDRRHSHIILSCHFDGQIRPQDV